METKECILSRRTIRKFKEQAVAPELLEKIVNTAAYAPSWKNTQCCRYLAVTNPEKKHYIAEHFFSGWPNNGTIVDGAPVLIVQCFIKGRSGFNRDGSFSTELGDRWQAYDCGIAAQTFCLAAQEEGLSTGILGYFDKSAMEEYLAIPEDRAIMAMIVLGYADEEPAAPKRKTAADLLTIL